MKTVNVLMSTYNGEQYLEEQLQSILNQVDIKVKILVRDDGSTDKTIEILNKYKNKGLLEWYTGENLRSARSFMNLVYNVDESEYYAFSDQDDVWNKDKLKIAVKALELQGDSHIPRLYCSNYQLVDANLDLMQDNGHVSTTKFNEALVSSCCTGCTTVFNNSLLKILQIYTPKVIVMHDDWAHKVCLAVGGTVIYDSSKTLKYRQHENNVDGGIHSKYDKMKQIINRISNKECIRSKQTKEILKGYKNLMPLDNFKIIKKFIDYYDGNFVERIKLVMCKEIKTPYKRLNRGFNIAILFKYF